MNAVGQASEHAVGSCVCVCVCGQGVTFSSAQSWLLFLHSDFHARLSSHRDMRDPLSWKHYAAVGGRLLYRSEASCCRQQQRERERLISFHWSQMELKWLCRRAGF